MTTTAEYAVIAAGVYQACNHYDPYLPPLSEDLARAWGKAFERHDLAAELLLAAVDKVYAENGSGFRPLPKDLIDAARAIRKDHDDRNGPSTEYEALCESKAETDTQAALRAAERRAACARYADNNFNEPTDSERLQKLAQQRRQDSPPADMTLMEASSE